MERRSGAIVAVIVVILITAPPNSVSAANLTILVPLKMGFNEFVRWSSPDRPVTPDSAISFSGFVIEVFRECIKRLDYPVNYTLVGFGDGIDDPSYAGIVDKLVSGVIAPPRCFCIVFCIENSTNLPDSWRNSDTSRPDFGRIADMGFEKFRPNPDFFGFFF
jgi:hypothetical protein